MNGTKAHKTAASLPLWRAVRQAPKLSDAARAEARFAEFLGKANGVSESLFASGRPRALLLSIADHSAFLWGLIAADPFRLQELLLAPPMEALHACLKQLKEAAEKTSDEAQFMRLLRRAKQETALLIALADLGGVWDVATVTRALADAADLFIQLALRFALREASSLRLADPFSPEIDCGVTVLALGKLGARELNYSSDVDLIVLYDSTTKAIPEGVAPAPVFVRLAKKMVRLLQDCTVDGYALRVDLRLRPDPGSTAIANSLLSAYDYYEVLGQNWERAAMIKARPVAGDLGLGAEFLHTLQPFIWRKYFDYAAIADIAAMKRQIHAVRGYAEVVVVGHDIKLGRGGIREIEFFVQTQQLIFGGKFADLRGTRTLDMLEKLTHAGWITGSAAADMREAYIFLREIEHRLQMINDEQTQRLPVDAVALRRFAQFCGYSTIKRFAVDLTHHLHLVSFHYARLFEQAPGLAASSGSLVFTGVVDDPETLETLLRLKFKRPASAIALIRGWHFGHHRAIRTPRAREVLTELVPLLLEAFAGTGDPDAALAAFDAALAKMPAAIELFSILKSNPRLCELFGDILGSAPRLARAVIQHPHVLDATIDGEALNAPLGAEAFNTRLSSFLDGKDNTEDVLDALRDFAGEESFLIGLRLLSGLLEPDRAGAAYSDLAGSLVDMSFKHVQAAFAREHGVVPGGQAIVLALGKLGSREMTATSDLDLMLIYDFQSERPQSDGRSSLHAVQYYTRIAQRLISALTVATRRGLLYEVDMRLRPSGGKGPVATQIGSFIAYQTSEAESWEHMALTRARVISGSAILAEKARAAIAEILQRPPGKSLQRDVFQMRRLIAKVKGENDPWDLKLASGGLMDIEFIAQYLALAGAHRHPEILMASTAAIVMQAGKLGVITGEDTEHLLGAHKLYINVMQMMRLMLDPGALLEDANAPLKQRLARAVGLPDFTILDRELRETRQKTRYLFNALLISD
jgi:glutamate-ammonia-ligase adenylyltransferase